MQLIVASPCTLASMPSLPSWATNRSSSCLRGGVTTNIEQVLVGLGALLGLILRSVFFLVGLNPPGGLMDMVLATCTVGVLLVLAMKAGVDLLSAEGRSKSRGAIIENVSTKLLHGGFMGSFKAYDPSRYVGDDAETEATAAEDGGSSTSGYGSAVLAGGAPPSPMPPLYNPPGPHDAAASAAAESSAARMPLFVRDSAQAGTVSSLVAAFVVPFVLSFMAYSGDKSQTLLRGLRGYTHFDLVLGTILGLVAAILTASFIGFVLERQLSDRRVAFLATIGFCAMALMGVSSIMVGIETGSVGSIKNAVGVLRVQGGHVTSQEPPTSVQGALLAISELMTPRRPA
eukprot:TRINITY_DN20224_c0_g1_i3.p1 TRINITY_DN20224_c0_g1~~TRINITY_DN20224_c0_g1_i3.p1  ORF type:complete len:344 (+),score=56.31 TRINITY_DN20224_c0_g1_i3:82-1113(+)